MNEEWNNEHKDVHEPEPDTTIGQTPNMEQNLESDNDLPRSSDTVNFTISDSKSEGSEQSAENMDGNGSVSKKQKEEKEKKTSYDSYQVSSHIPPAEPLKQRPPKPANSLGKKFAICVSLAVVFGLVAGICFQAVNAVGNRMNGGSQKEQVKIGTTDSAGNGDNSVINPTKANASQGSNTVAQVAKNSMPSVVAITNVSVQEIPNYFGYGSQPYEGKSSGSGIIVGQNDTELLIATNNHVVSGATSLSVCFIGQEVNVGESTDGTGAEDAKNAVSAQIKGTDSDNDLAVISVKLSDIPVEISGQIKIAQIGDSDSLEVGEQVVAIGNALGYGQSVTSGYISALERKVTIDNVTSSLIQTDTAINPGNSGGALLNMNGELVGINAVKFASSEVEGMGYAIPVSTAEPILNELMSRETKYKVTDEDKASYIGITCKNVTSETAQMYIMPLGVFVADVTAGGPAENSGLKKGDIITKVDGISISTYDELVATLEYYEAGESVEVVISRTENGEYKEQTITVTLGSKKDMPKTGTNQVQPQQGQ